MLRIRLSRGGKKRQPHYRVVVADVDAKRDGRVVERIGYYAPLDDPSTFVIEEARALYWLSVGAQPSDAVKRLLEKQGTLNRLQRFHKGESLDALVAEFEGRPLPMAEAAPAAEVVDEVVAEVAAAVEAVVEAEAETADEAEVEAEAAPENGDEA